MLAERHARAERNRSHGDRSSVPAVENPRRAASAIDRLV
jgi:hypothetical protein